MPKQTRSTGSYIKIALLAAFLLVAAVVPQGASADPISEFAEKEKRLHEKAQEADSLEEKLDVLDQTAEVKLAASASLQGRVAEVSDELAETTNRLDDLLAERSRALDSLQKVMRVDYLEGTPDAWEVLAGHGSIAETLSEQAATGTLGDYARGLAEGMVEAEKLINRDRGRLVSRKRMLQTLQSEAERQLKELKAVRKVKEGLLDETRGEEARYREQYESARDQLIRMGLFARAGCNEVGSRPWDGADGYFNQCDSRWADVILGNSTDSTMGDYGCGVAAAAMVFKQYGIATDPVRLNDKLRRIGAFDRDLLYWKSVHHAADGRLKRVNDPAAGVDRSHIRRQIARNKPVIVWIDRGAQYNHYVVLLRKHSRGGYVMHDSIYGPNLRFEDRYSWDAIVQYIAFEPA